MRFLKILKKTHKNVDFVDLSKIQLPICDGNKCYENKNVKILTKKLSSAQGIVIASPIYNYDLNAAAKNLVELTGSAWKDKIIGFLCTAGGSKSYMSVMPFANSLMLDYRCHILPRFVYAEENAFRGNEVADEKIIERLEELAKSFVRVTKALSK